MARARGALAIPVLTIVIVLIASVVLWSRGSLNAMICDGDCGPAYVTAPRSLTDDSSPQKAGVSPVPSGSLDGTKVKAAIAKALGDDALGDHVGLAVMGLTGEVLVSEGAGTYIPASTTKLLTGFAALSAISAQVRFSTRTVLAGDQLVLVGGGDPYLAVKRPKEPRRAVRADLTTLARRTADALRRQGIDRVNLAFDESIFSGPAASKGWPDSYVTGNIVTPISGLWADQGVTDGVRSPDPAWSAATIFARLLQDRGVEVTGRPAEAAVPAGAELLASMPSATVAQIVDAMVRSSDNQAAEVLLRHVAIASDRPATFDGGAEAVQATLEKAGVDTAGLRLRDGSGLSRDNRVSPTTLAQTVVAALAGLPTASLLSDLPVSGFNGTLAERFSRSTRAYGVVRAKTGTLTGVHSLAGYATSADGLPVIFALMSDGTREIGPAATEAALDRVAAAIATCACGTTP